MRYRPCPRCRRHSYLHDPEYGPFCDNCAYQPGDSLLWGGPYKKDLR